MDHTSNVTSTILRWNAPAQTNIAWFKLFRITANDTTLFTDGSCIAQIPYTSCPSYTDVFTTLGDGTDRWYALKSISWSNGSSAFSNVMSAVRTSGVSLSGPVILSGVLTVSTLNVTANASVQGTMHVSGAATFGSTVTVSGAVSIGNTLHVCGSTTFGDNVIICGTLTVCGGLTYCGSLTIGGDLGVCGDTTLTGSLQVSSTVSMSSTLHVSGAATFGGTLNVSGDLTLNSTWRFTEVGGQLHLQKDDGGWTTVAFFNT